MSITIKYFASLREQMGKAEQTLSADGVTTVADVVGKLADTDLPENTLVAVNQEYANDATQVKAGDEVAFFPPVTGG
ncbi:MAG TPA: molybdopterin converting factor subunit 1 [Chromatiales bacterium]|nr:molybdopterin converting factor subunit 1 [Thiotrichales bacterium]HIP68158.1 molybdopterin converting factor subunit 1 [Chromatiales bacterium]